MVDYDKVIRTSNTDYQFLATMEVIWLENLGVIFHSFPFINSFLRTNTGQKYTIAFLTLLFKPSIRVSIVYDGIPRVRKVKIFTL